MIIKKVLSGLLVVALTSPLYSAPKPKTDIKSRFEKLELFNKVLFLIESQYYRDVDTEKLINGAIKGMVSALDPHSTFLDSELFTKMQEETRGEFGGLGIEVQQKDGVIIVITPIDDTPAFKAGIKSGDKIVEIDHESTLGMSLDQAVEKMRGKPDSKISVGVIREGVEGVKTFVLRRQVIKVKPVKFALVKDQYAYIRLTQFQKNSSKEITKAIKKIRKSASSKGGLKGMVLDLRSNPGGLLDEAVNVSSLFLKDGVVVSTEGRDPKVKEIKYVKKTGYKELEVPLVVLINGASASASEIVAGALKDSKRAIIMGSQSFGKGSVQTVAKIDESNGVKLTIAQYMTPQGRKIQAIGIKPDIVIPDIDQDVFEENTKEELYVREIDLRNHLTATIETEEEKSERLKKEKLERKKRVEKIRKSRESKKKTTTSKDYGPYDPGKDFQVLQAINYLKGLTVLQKMIR